jgi:hypothetical protein
LGDQAGNACLGECAHGEGVGLDALTEALIGEVEERDQAGALENISQLGSLIQT